MTRCKRITISLPPRVAALAHEDARGCELSFSTYLRRLIEARLFGVGLPAGGGIGVVNAAVGVNEVAGAVTGSAEYDLDISDCGAGADGAAPGVS
jgi:hypothetical protein